MVCRYDQDSRNITLYLPSDYDVPTVFSTVAGWAHGSDITMMDGAQVYSGSIVLANVSGDLDDIADGTNYGKIALTSISAGKIIVAGLDAGVTARMFTDGTIQANIEAWVHVSDVTMIDGGKVYTGTLIASAINGAGFGTLTITSGKIAINTADALEIQSSGNIKVLVGGDIDMQATTGNASDINFICNARTFTLRGSYDNDSLNIITDTDGVGEIIIGKNIDDVTKLRPSKIRMYSKNEFLNSAEYDSATSKYCLFWLTSAGALSDAIMYSQFGTSIAHIKAYTTATLEYVEIRGDSFRPFTDSAISLGTSALCWSDVFSDILTLHETTTPTAVTDYAKVYTKADNKLYFQDGAGTEKEVAFV